jgi:dTDP-glucose 4,6-dehydratase
MQTLLVTGGAGFIGGNFIREMLRTRPDCRIVNLDKLTYAGNLESLRDVDHEWGGERYFFVRGDIADRETVRMIFEGGALPRPEIIVNFAAESHVDRSILDATPFIETNVKGTQVLLDAAKAFGVKKFVQVSTDEVYGTLALADHQGFREDFNLQPNSPYSASKASADLLCKAYFKTYQLPVVITRCCNNYGPYQFPEKLIPLMILNAVEGRSLPVYGDGMHVREWIHVLDHARAVAFVMDRGTPGEVYNIGTADEKPNLETVKTILRCVAELGGKDPGELEKLITFVKDRPGHDRRYAIDSGKLRAMGWRPAFLLDAGMKETVAWYLKNTTWCETVRSGAYREYYEKWYGQK